MNSLAITAHDGKPLPNRLIQARDTNDRIALIFPGRGYTCAMPLLYYATRALVDNGYDVLHVEYHYDPADFPEPAGDRWRDALRLDVEGAYAAVVAEGQYNSVLLLGKSLGTIAIALLLANHPELAESDCIWLTPLISIDRVREVIASHASRSLVVIGSLDPHHNQKRLHEIEVAGAAVVVIDRADHGLEIPDDLESSIEALRQTTMAIERFSNKNS